MKTQTKTTKKAELTKEEMAEMDKMSNVNDILQAPFYKLSSIRLNGKNGNFFKTAINSDGSLKTDEGTGKALLEDLGAEIKGVILRSRVSFAAQDADSEIFSSENDKSKDFEVFVKTPKEQGGFSIQHAFTGKINEVKSRFPELKYIQILYFLNFENGEISRLKVKGKSLGNLFDYFRTFTREERIFEYTTIFSFEEQSNKFGKFFVSIPKRGDKIENLREIQSALKSINQKLTEIENYYEEQKKNRSDSIPIEEAPEPQEQGQTALETPKGVNDGELPKPPATDEINVKEIPFGDKNDGDPSDKELEKAGL